MRLISLVTKNFKRLGDFSCDFTSGLNVIAGDNARGKSTLLQAVQAAFFGASSIAGKVENIPTWGQKDFEVFLRFEAAGKQYEVTRKKSTAKLVLVEGGEHGDSLLANGNTPVTAAIEDLFGLSAKDYSLFWQSKQGESAGILTFGATALNKKVEEFAGVDLIDKVQTRAQQRATQLAASADALAVSDEDREAAKTALSDTESALHQAHNDAHAAAEALSTMEPFVPQEILPGSEALRKEKESAATLLTKLERAEDRLAAAEKALAAAQANASHAPAKQEEGVLLTQLDGLREQGVAARDALEIMRTKEQSRRDAESALKSAQRGLESANAEHTTAEDAAQHVDLDGLRDAEAVARTYWASQSDIWAGRKAKVRDLAQLSDGSSCPTCGHSLTDHDPAKLAEELEAANFDEAESRRLVESAHRAAESAAKSYKDGQRVVETLERATKAMEKAESAVAHAQEAASMLTGVDASVIAEQEAEVDRLRTAYAAKKAELDGVKDSNARWELAVTAVRNAEGPATAAKAEVERLAAEYEALPEPPTDEQIAEAAAAERAQLTAAADYRLQKSNLEAAVRSSEQAERHATANHAAAVTALKKLDEQAEKAKAATADAARCRRLVQFLREKRQAYLQEVWTTVLGMASKLVREASAGEITGVANDGGEFMFQENGVFAPVAGSASGAQKALIGVSLRIALARCLYGSESPLIFDEPTESCSERNAGGMAATLATCASQVLLITHRETDQGLAQNVINVGE